MNFILASQKDQVTDSDEGDFRYDRRAINGTRNSKFARSMGAARGISSSTNLALQNIFRRNQALRFFVGFFLAADLFVCAGFLIYLVC